MHSLLFFNLCCSTAAILWSGLSEIIQKAATRVALWPSVKSTKRCQSPNPKPRQHHMFASYEIGTSCTSLTAITRYDLDESADVLLMDHLCIVESTMMKGKGNISLEEDRKSSMNIWWKHSSYQENGGDLGIKISWKLNISEEVNNDEEISTVNAEEFWRQHSISALHFFNQRNTTWYQAEAV